MGKFRRSIFMILLAVVFGCSCVSAKARAQSFLWKIQLSTGEVSFVLGSIHALRKDTYPLNPAIENAYKQSTVLAVEADVSSQKMAEVMKLTMSQGMYQGEDTLRQNLSDKAYELARKKLKELGMDINGMNKFKPWMVAMTITGLELMKHGFDPNHGIDKYFLERAVGKKDIVELEGIEYQIKFFNDMSRLENEKFLTYSVLEANQLGKEIENMVEIWLQGDVKKMESLISENVRKYPEFKDFYRRINDDRNVEMAKKIASYLGSGKTVFVVVGAAHLLGDKGIIKLLENQGIKITQL